jgi:hypothetical protein
MSLEDKHRQIGGVCIHVFPDVRSKKTPCIPIFLAPKTQYLRCVLTVGAKTILFTVFGGEYLAKTLVFTQFSACCNKSFLHAKGIKQRRK